MSQSPKKPEKSVKTLSEQLAGLRSILGHYAWLILIVFISALYGYVFLKINSFSNEQPTQTAINNDLSSYSTPDINPSVVSEVEQLQNNSVSVQALFNQARQNPFSDSSQ